MSVRQTDQNVIGIIRDLQEKIKKLESTLGSARLNSIRLGNWVLEAEADELVRMTNLVTGVVSYIGANGDTAVSPPDEIVWSYSGSVAPTSDTRGQIWIAPSQITLQSLTMTVATTSTTDIDVVTRVDGTIIATSTLASGTSSVAIPMVRSLAKGATLQPEILAPESGTPATQLAMIYRYER